MNLPDLNWSFWIGAFAAVTLLPYLRRLSLINWRSHLWHVVAMHLCIALWLLSVAYAGLTYQFVPLVNGLGVLGAFFVWESSRARWKHGPPEYTRSGPATFDDEPHHRAISTHGE